MKSQKNKMSFIRLGIITSVSAVIFSGCVSYDGRPLVATYSPPPEYKLKSITHWNIIANDVATQIQSTLQPADALDGVSQTMKPNILPAIYIASPNETDFDKVLSSQLQSSLLAKGFEIKSTPKNALTINFKVNAVMHTQVRRSIDYAPGTLTALAAGILVIRDAALYNPTPSGLAVSTLGITAAADLYALWLEMNRRPNTEIALTVYAQSGDKYIIHRTDSYYIDTVDTGLFVPSKSKVFEVTSGAVKK